MRARTKQPWGLNLDHGRTLSAAAACRLCTGGDAAAGMSGDADAVDADEVKPREAMVSWVFQVASFVWWVVALLSRWKPLRFTRGVGERDGERESEFEKEFEKKVEKKVRRRSSSEIFDVGIGRTELSLFPSLFSPFFLSSNTQCPSTSSSASPGRGSPAPPAPT